MKRSLTIVVAVATSLFFSGCMKVGVGRNGSPPKSPSESEENTGAQTTGTETPSAPSKGSGTERSTESAPASATCYGPQQEHNPISKQVCEIFTEQRQQQFPTLYQTYCVEKINVNQIYASCSYMGQGSAARHLKKIEISTEKGDKDGLYTYFTSMSLTGKANRSFEFSEIDQMIKTNFKKYVDDGFTQVPNVTFEPIASSVNQAGNKILDYRATLISNQGASVFESQTEYIQVSDRLLVSFDFGKRFEGKLKHRNYMLVTFIHDDGQQTAQVYERRRGEFRGMFTIIKKLFSSTDTVRLEATYANVHK